MIVIWRKLLGVFWFATGIIIGIGCARIWFALYPRPGPVSSPAPAQVVISPPAPAQTPQVAIRGHASGPARRAEISRRPQEARKETGGGSNTPLPIAEPAPPEPAFYVGERAEGTIQGEIEVVDRRGREVTAEPVPISGTYSVEFPAPGEAQVELEFDAPAMVSIKDPDRALCLGASTGWIADEPFLTLHAGYERRWEITRSLDARAEVEAGWAWTPGGDGPYAKLEATIEYRF